jgi:cellulose biosynthesis protein BcsQ
MLSGGHEHDGNSGLNLRESCERELGMKVVSVINYKGGVGKTSLTANLAAQLAWEKRRVLLIDLDAQASLTFSFISPDVWEKDFSEKKTIKSWFESFDSGKPISLASLIDTPQRVKGMLHGKGKLDIIYSHLGLINVDLELATKLGGGKPRAGQEELHQHSPASGQRHSCRSERERLRPCFD